MYIFTPNTLIESAKINANFDELKTKTDYLSTPDAAWIEVGSGGSAPAFANSWVNYPVGDGYNTCAFRKDALGYVHIKGLTASGTMNAAIFTLPVGYRPLKSHIIACVSNQLLGRINVYQNGQVICSLGSNAWVSLDNITFKAEQ